MTKSCTEEQSRVPQAKDSTPCLDTHFKDPPNLLPPSAGLGYSQPGSFGDGYVESQEQGTENKKQSKGDGLAMFAGQNARVRDSW